jgi:NADPH2:quinone reductase
MRAICVNPDRTLEARELPAPSSAAPGHVILRSAGSAINPGDLFFLRNPAGLPPRSNDVWGASGAGTVLAVGDGVDQALVGKRIAVYRSLVRTEEAIGCWSEVQQVPALACCVLPDEVEPLDYCGSLVNAITPWAFWQLAKAEGHEGILITAGTSATGIAMLAIALALEVPVVSIVGRPEGKVQLAALGATRIVVQTDADFDEQLQKETASAAATAVFEGVSGELLTRIAPLLPVQSTVYGYGFLGGQVPFTLLGRVMMARSLTVKSFSNFATPTVRDPQALAAALADLAQLIGAPHFKTRRGPSFGYAEIDRAIAHAAKDGSRAVLVPG